MRYYPVTLLLVALSLAVARASGPAGEPEAYYTEAQAARGEALFEEHCGSCHFAEPDPEKAKLETRGYLLGRVRTVSNLGGTYIVEETSRRPGGRRVYTTVYYLFRQLESMPSVTDSISQQERTDILAYLLRQNRFAAGRTDLEYDLAAMKLMPLDEPGFVRLFNGKDFSGWKVLWGLGCDLPPGGCGKTDPGTTVFVRNGIFHASNKEHGIAYTEKVYKDFTLRLDYLAEVPADFEGDDIYYYANSGYHLFLFEENLTVWPKALTFRGEQRNLLNPIIGSGAGVAAKAKAYTFDYEAMKRAVRPLGHWNSLEFASKGGDVKAYLNDMLITTITQHEYTKPGHIGLQIQGFPMRWRNIRIREE